MLETIIAFASGVGVALVGTLITAVLQRSTERKKRIERIQFQVYVNLMDLYGFYFWVINTPIEKIDIDFKKKIRDIAWKTADLLRLEDSVPHMEDILKVLMSHEFKNAFDRYKEMSRIIDLLGSIVNPSYQDVVRDLDKSNLIRYVSGDVKINEFTTPMSMWPF